MKHWFTALKPFGIAIFLLPAPLLRQTNVQAQVLQPISWADGAAAPITRYEAQRAVVNGSLYVLGGFISGTTNETTFRADKYDPVTDQWAQIADLPDAVTHAGTATDGPFIYVAGGFNGNHPAPVSDHVWQYNSLTNTWTAFVPLPEARASGVLVRLGRKLHFFGGTIRINGTFITDTPEHWALNLDLANPIWEPLAPLPNPRNHLGGIAFNGKIYAIGGQYLGLEGTDNQTSVHEYDPQTNTWTAKASLPRPTGHLSATIIELNNRIVVVSGVTNGHVPLANILEFDPVANTWTELSPLPMPRHSPTVGVINNRIVVNGGINNDGIHANTWVSGVITNHSEPIPTAGHLLYPNPATKGQVTVRLAASQRKSCTIRILDMLGREVQYQSQELPASQTEFLLPLSVPAGLYTVVVEYGHSISVQKLQVK